MLCIKNTAKKHLANEKNCFTAKFVFLSKLNSNALIFPQHRKKVRTQLYHMNGKCCCLDG